MCELLLDYKRVKFNRENLVLSWLDYKTSEASICSVLR